MSLSGEDSGYWEYLKFESETTGKYYLYKDGSEVPEYARDFVYEPASGKFSAGSGESAVSSYMFDTTKDGKKVSVIAKEEMNCKAERPALCAEWNAAAVSFMPGFLWNTFLSAFSSSWLPLSILSCSGPISKRNAKIAKPLPNLLCVGAGLCPARETADKVVGITITVRRESPV